MNSLRSNTGDEEEGKVREKSKEETYWKRVFNQNRRRFLKGVKWRRLRAKIFMVLLIIQVSLLDPLFFYIPVVHGRQKCVRLDKKLGTAVMVFRSLIDSFYVIYIIVELHKHLLAARGTGKYQYTRLGKIFLIDFLAVLPLPQVVILIFIPAMRGSRFLNAMYLLRSVVLFQFVPRCFRAYLCITSRAFGVPAKARVKFSPLIFLLGINIIGAFWYFLSVERLVQCWTKACKSTHVGCVHSFYCKGNIDHTSLNDLCNTDGQKTDFFDFGIFSDAVKHHVLEMTYFPKKFLYCFQWSLQNLSGFGQNLQTSTYIWENVFAISMSILGLFLFLLLIGSLQATMRAQRKEKREKKKLKAIKSIENWPPLKKFSVNLGKEIKNELKNNWEKYTTEAGIILRDLPTNLKGRIEREHSLELLKKVKTFKAIGKNSLNHLSKSITLKQFEEGESIVEEGKTINDMFFILNGTLEARSSPKNNLLKDGDICGEEVIWKVIFHDKWPSCELWKSTVTIKSVTRVHALALPADKLTDFIRHLPEDLQRRVQRELYFVFLKKVKVLKHIGQNKLDKLSEFIQPKLFDRGECIVDEGKTINDIVFIVHGKLKAKHDLLKEGDICGEEVTQNGFRSDRSFDQLSLSTVTIKAITKVHALVLPAQKVRDFLRDEEYFVWSMIERTRDSLRPRDFPRTVQGVKHFLQGIRKGHGPRI